MTNPRGIAEDSAGYAAGGSLIPARRWTMGSAVFDERSMELAVGDQVVHLERRPLEVLLFLLHHAGEVVTKQELAENLWPGRILTETVLTRCISLLRQALGENRDVIKTVHGYGYRIVDVAVEVSSAPPPPALDFAPGDAVPHRPQWKLVERLGTGGHGEAWLARHEKTGEARVFKFALDGRSLSSLKREITLYRLMRDTLGDKAAVVRIFEWNLEEPPYFLEMEYVLGRDLQTWSDAQGGLNKLPIGARINLAIEIAQAVAAAHSVGVLHKDIKPGNVLIEPGPKVRLCDFGSGSVLDPARLEALGITRMGMTKTLTKDLGATPLYLAPEVIAGQPFTVKSDVYSLAVLIYQILVGNLRISLAPGWENNVPDELLCEDIEFAGAGDAARRCSDASLIAERLGTLESRREALASRRAAFARAERARKTAAELRRMRWYAAALAAVTCAAIVSGVMAIRSRNVAVASAATTKAISDFLAEDVLRVDRSVERPQDRSYQSSLDSAAARVANRFATDPAAAANVYWLLGRKYQELGLIEKATGQYEQAAKLFDGVHGANASSTLLAKERLAAIYVEHGRQKDGLAILASLRKHWASESFDKNLSALVWRIRLARLLVFASQFAEAERDLRAVLQFIPGSRAPDEETLALMKQWFGFAPNKDVDVRPTVAAHASELMSAILGEVGADYEEAESQAREAMATYLRLFGDTSEPVAFVQLRLGSILANRGRYEESELLLVKARDFYDVWLPARHEFRSVSRFWLAELRLEQQRPIEALAMLKQAQEFCTATACRTRMKVALSANLGRAYQQLGQYDLAIEAFKSAFNEKSEVENVGTIRARVGLADTLREAGMAPEAWAVLRRISTELVSNLAAHPVRAEFLRVEALLNLESQEFERARAALQDSMRIFESRLGANHWRTQRARDELARAIKASG